MFFTPDAKRVQYALQRPSVFAEFIFHFWRNLLVDHPVDDTVFFQFAQLLDHPLLKEIAKKHGKTAAQVILRWDLQNGVITIPKLTKAQRIAENADIFGFELTAEEMIQIAGLNENTRVGPDPDNFDF